MEVLALDLSLTGSGITTSKGVTTVKTNLKDEVRLIYILDSIAEAAEAAYIEFVIVEGLAYGSTMGKATERAGLWWLVKMFFWDYNIPVAVAPPTTLKKYATGKGNADKDTVMLEVAKRYTMFDVKNNNEADSVALYAMAMHHLGNPIAEVPATHLEGLLKVQWPEGKPYGSEG